jgi:hypothetical protein
MPIERDNRNVNDAIDEIVLEVNEALEDITPTYSIYAARFTQSGTSNPVVTSIINTTGQTITWTRASAGVYEASVTGNVFVSGQQTGGTSGIVHEIMNNVGTIVGVYNLYYTASPSKLTLIIANTFTDFVDYSTIANGSLDLPLMLLPNA